jgi:DNA-binding IclR family transcriptional regulator
MSAEIEWLRTRSRALFTQTYRLEVMLAIADSEGGLVTLTELSKLLGVSASNIQKPLTSLIAGGLLCELPTEDRRKFLLRNDSLAWDWVREIRDEARRSTGSSVFASTRA